MIPILLSCLFLLISAPVKAQEITAKFMKLNNTFFEKPEPMGSPWNEVEKTTVILFPQNITTPSIYQTTVGALEAKAIHNGKWVAVLLSWDDPTKDFHLSLDHFSDACAIQFPLKEAEKTSPFMGNKDAPVEILHWKAIWQNDIEAGFQKVTDLYPNTWVDTYRFGKNVARDAKNPVSQMERKVPVEELMAAGFGTLTSQSLQDSSGWGVWKDGKWFVVLTHKMKTRDKHDPVLRPGEKTSIAFALWEGGHKNGGARKNYAPWVPFVLEKK